MLDQTRAARPWPARSKVAAAISYRIEIYIQWAGFAFWGFLIILALTTAFGIRLM